MTKVLFWINGDWRQRNFSKTVAVKYWKRKGMIIRKDISNPHTPPSDEEINSAVKYVMDSPKDSSYIERWNFK